MIVTTQGLVIRTLHYSETSLIVRWLTPDLGRIATIAKGARRPKSPFLGKLDLFVEGALSFSRSQRSDLHSLREIVVTDFHLPLRDNMDRLQLAAYAVALVEQTTESDTPLPEVFQLLHGLLVHLTIAEARPRLAFAFELKLLTLLGLAPSAEATTLTADGRALVATLTREDWAPITGLKANARTVTQLAKFLNGFLVYHLGKIPKLRGQVLKTGSG
jgi:DNA repair protein RecO (recombination protein O)